MIDTAMLTRLMVLTGFAPPEIPTPTATKEMLALAEAIWVEAQQDEREACAKVLDFEVCGSQGFAGPTRCILPPGHDGAHKYGVPIKKTQRECAAAIRMRSNALGQAGPKAIACTDELGAEG